MINMKNTEQASAVYALAAAGFFAFLSFYNTDAETYLFPRIIAVVLVILSVALFIVNSASKEVMTGTSSHFKQIWPGLLIGLVYLLVMEEVGFYVSSCLAFLALLMCYGKRAAFNPKAVFIKLLISLGFMTVLYFLFWFGLNVRTPTGLLF